MTLSRCWKQRNDFGADELLSDLPLPDHDEDLGTDASTTLEVNYRWRVYIATALEEFFNRAKRNMSQAELDDFDPQFDALIEDLYDI